MKLKIDLNSVVIFFSVLFKYLIEIGIERTFLYMLLLGTFVIEIFIMSKKKYDKRELLRLGIFSIIGLIFTITYNDANFLIYLLFAISINNMGIKKFLKIFFISSLVLYCMIIVLSKIDILPEKLMIRNTEDGVNIRHSLGFSHPNSVFLFALPIILSSYCLFKNDIKYYVVVLAICIGLYILSDSRSGFYSIIILIVGSFFIKKVKIKKMLYIMPFILTIISYLIAIQYGNGNNKIDTFLSYRPSYWKIIIDNCNPFTVFGDATYTEIYLDNFYLSQIYRYGIISLVTYIYFYIKGIKKISSEKIILCILVFGIYGLIEANTIIGSINFTMGILLCNTIFTSKSCTDKLTEI